jgi:hypothetical protein
MGRKLKIEGPKIDVSDTLSEKFLEKLEDEWTTPEELTASAIIEDTSSKVDGAKIRRELANQLERVINSGEASEVIVRNVHALLIRWRTG